LAVLVAGVGYIGAALAASLLRAGERVVALDNGFSTDFAAVAALAREGDFHLVRGSVTETRDVSRALRRGPFEVVYYLAAQASAAVAHEQPRYTERTNLTGPRVVLDAVVRHQVPRVVYASSIRVYGTVLPALIDETTSYGPQPDLTHLSQVYGEKLLETYARPHGFVGVAVRLAVVYGVGPVTKTDYPVMTVPNKFCLQAIRGEALQVYPGAATPTAFIHLDDACSALRAAASAPWPAGFHAANASGEVCTVPEVAGLVTQVARARGLSAVVCSAAQPAPTPDQPPIPAAHASQADEPTAQPRVQSRLHGLGWRPTRTLADSVGDILDYFRTQEAA
jgi:UDP-glucose 4-epimerase